MGIDVHVLKFLSYAKDKKQLGDTMTIGRQGLHAKESRVKEIVGTSPDYTNQPYCEELLIEYFGATLVESVDNSDYERATHVHNMNEALPKQLFNRFDTVIDGGCLEHVFNVSQALKNCSLMCKVGGQIIHILPANNFCGHGFWQFSPELFFSLYSRKNGYAETEVFLADLSDETTWYQVKEPKNGRRVNVSSSTELYVLVRTVLTTEDFSHANVQQSDYVFEWERSTQKASEPVLETTGFRKILKKQRFLYDFLAKVYYRYLQSRTSTRLSNRNPGLTRVQIGK